MSGAAVRLVARTTPRGLATVRTCAGGATIAAMQKCLLAFHAWLDEQGSTRPR
jgi:hypothetical protein